LGRSRRARLAAAELRHVEPVPQFSRRVIRRDVERLEIPPIVLDRWPLEDLEAEAVQDFAQFTLDAEHRVQVPHPDGQSGSGQVDALLDQALLKVPRTQRLYARGDRRLHLAADLVGQCPDGW